MKAIKGWELELQDEFSDFLWDNVEWWAQNKEFHDGCKIPTETIEIMNQSLDGIRY